MRRTAVGAIGFAALLWGVVSAQTPAERPQLAEEVFKNVQVLRGIPVKEFMGTMGMFSASLGLNCTDRSGITRGRFAPRWQE